MANGYSLSVLQETHNGYVLDIHPVDDTKVKNSIANNMITHTSFLVTRVS